MMNKKLITLLCLAMLGLGVSACSGANTATTAAANAELSTAETGGRADKVPDPNAPVLSIVSVYSLTEDKQGIDKSMDAIDESDPQLLLDKLAEYGVVAQGTIVNTFSTTDGKGSLDISALDTSNPLIVNCIANTFIENYELDSLTLSVAGVSSAETKDLTFLDE